jgi:hypothetical protein
MENEIITNSDALALYQVEIDSQIATAKQYPRDLELFKTNCEAMIKISPDIAAACCYHLERKNADGSKKVIEGPSIRLAEIMMTNWKNLRVSSKVLGEEKDFIIVNTGCHDLEANNAIEIETKRRITTKNGSRYGADMIQVTTAAAHSVGIRNSLFKIIPNIYTQHYLEIAKRASIGPEDQFHIRVQRAFEYFQNMGISEDRIMQKLGIEKRTQVTKEHLNTLQGTRTALKDQLTTIDDEFSGGKLKEPEAGVDKAPRPGDPAAGGKKEKSAEDLIV